MSIKISKFHWSSKTKTVFINSNSLETKEANPTSPRRSFSSMSWTRPTHPPLRIPETKLTSQGSGAVWTPRTRTCLCHRVTVGGKIRKLHLRARVLASRSTSITTQTSISITQLYSIIQVDPVALIQWRFLQARWGVEPTILRSTQEYHRRHPSQTPRISNRWLTIARRLQRRKLWICRTSTLSRVSTRSKASIQRYLSKATRAVLSEDRSHTLPSTTVTESNLRWLKNKANKLPPQGSKKTYRSSKWQRMTSSQSIWRVSMELTAKIHKAWFPKARSTSTKTRRATLPQEMLKWQEDSKDIPRTSLRPQEEW